MTDGGPIRTQPIDRRRLGGDIIFQDFRDDVDPSFRYVPKGCRIEKDDPTFGYPIVEGHDPGDPEIGLQGTASDQRSIGDIFPWLAWFPDRDLRAEGSWNPCFAAVVLEDEFPNEGASVPAETRTSDPSVTTTTPTGLQPKGDVDLATRTAEDEASMVRRTVVQPVRTKNYLPDERYQPKVVSVPPNTPRLAKGTPGVVLRATREGEQIDLFLPTQNGPMISVNHAGDPKLSSVVYDLTPGNELDPDRGASLHTVWRVIPVDANACDSKLTPFPILAWQLGLSGQDRHAGSGLVVDVAGAPPTEPEEDRAAKKIPGANQTKERANSDGDATRTREGSEAGGEAAAAGEDGRPEAAGDQGEAIAKSISKLNARKQRLLAEIETLAFGAGRSFGSGGPTLQREIANRQGEIKTIDAQIADLQAQAEAIKGTGTGDDGSDATDVPSSVEALVVACASSKLSGPLEVGRVVDPHRIGTDKDGNPINALHLATSSLFQGGPGDAPLAFENVLYSKPSPLPLRAPVHIRIDPDSIHAWACGTAPGLWRLEAETVIMGDATPRSGVMHGPTKSGPSTGGGSGGGAGGGGDGGGDGDDGGAEDSAGTGLADSEALFDSFFSPTSGVGTAAIFDHAYTTLLDWLGIPTNVIDSDGQFSGTYEDWLRLRAQGLIDQAGVIAGAAVVVGDNDQTVVMKLGGVSERYATIPQCVRVAGGMVFSPSAHGEGETDFSKGGFIQSKELDKIKQAPDGAKFLVTSANPAGGWNTWFDGRRLTDGYRYQNSSVLNVVGPDVTLGTIEDELPSEFTTTVNFIAGSSLSFATPDRSAGGVKSGYTFENDSVSDELLIRSVDVDGIFAGGSSMDTSGRIGSDAIRLQTQLDGSSLPTARAYLYQEDGTNLAAGTVAVRKSGGAIVSLESAGGTGDVVGPGASTPDSIPRWNGVTGVLLKNGILLSDDAGRLSNVLGIDLVNNGVDPGGTNPRVYAQGEALFYQSTTTLYDLTAAVVSTTDLTDWDNTGRVTGALPQYNSVSGKWEATNPGADVTAPLNLLYSDTFSSTAPIVLDVYHATTAVPITGFGLTKSWSADASFGPASGTFAGESVRYTNDGRYATKYTVYVQYPSGAANLNESSGFAVDGQYRHVGPIGGSAAGQFSWAFQFNVGEQHVRTIPSGWTIMYVNNPGVPYIRTGTTSSEILTANPALNTTLTLTGTGSFVGTGTSELNLAGGTGGVLVAASSFITTGTVRTSAAAGSPEGAVIGTVGDTYTNATNGVKYQKESGAGNVGWSIAAEIPTPGATGFGDVLRLTYFEQELGGLTGATATATNLIPPCSTIVALGVRVTTTITGATSFDVGDTGAAIPGAYGAGIGIAAGTTACPDDWTVNGPNTGVNGRDVVLTANGGNFTAGAVRISGWAQVYTAPTS